MRAIRRFTVRAALPEPLAPLRDLTLNLRWSWHAETRDLFAAIDPAGWDAAGHDPVALLGEVPPAQLESLGHDQAFLRRLDDAARDLDQYLTGPRWYQLHADGGSPAGPPAAIAYFSPEYGITQALPQYSGGLGILAGDHLKAGSDLGVPLIGVGLLYRHGYFTQSLSPEGWQMERYPAGDPNGLPLTLLRAPDGTAVRVSVALAEGKLLSAQIWVAQVGRVPLLLLDSYVEENEPTLREVTDRLYGGGGDHRLRQELLLGMGESARSARSALSPGTPSRKSSTPTRDTPASSASNGSASTPSGASASRKPSSCAGPAPCSPRTPRCRPGSTASTGTCSSGTSPGPPPTRPCLSTGCWPWARRPSPAATRPCSTWP